MAVSEPGGHTPASAGSGTVRWVRRGETEVLIGADSGRYPQGNTVIVHGADRTVMIDPSLSLHVLGAPNGIDQILLTHVHEDHIAGLSLYPDVAVYAHELDHRHLRSIDDLLGVYGLAPDAAEQLRSSLVNDFHFHARPDAVAFSGGETFCVGGSTTITVVPTPGHTAGHCAFLIEPDGVLVIGDVDLSGFGPYYADVESDLDAFIDSMALLRGIDAAWYVTFHHKGVVEGRPSFVRQLDTFAAVIDRRDEAIVDFLSQPRTLADMVARRFLYRPHVDLPWVDAAEERTIRRHLDRLLASGAVEMHDDEYVRRGI